MPVQSAIISQCLAQAVQASSRLISSCVDEAVAGLVAAEQQGLTAAQRHELSDACRELLKHKAAWVDHYPRALRSAFEAPAQAPASAPAPLRIDTLTLVGDDQVDQEIAASRLSEQLQTDVAQPLAELDGLMSSLLGLPAVRAEANPLRPAVFARVLRATMADAAQQPAWPALWIRHMAPAMSRELDQLYRLLATQLKQADVHAASYRVVPLRDGPASGHAPLAPAAPAPAQAQAPSSGPARAGGRAPAFAPVGGSGGGSMRPGGSGWAELQPHSISQQLIHEFLQGGSPQGDAALAPAYYDRATRDVEQLESAPDDRPAASDPVSARQYAQTPVVDRPLRAVSTETSLDKDVWGEYAASRRRELVRAHLKQQARDVAQVLGLEVVRKLVNQVAQDPRLLAPVRESIVALEPSLLRLAMVDPRFFSDERHAGRRLVERVAERSLKFNDEFGSQFGDFCDSVAACFNGLNAVPADEVQDAKPFESALATLEASWAAQDEREAAQRSAVLNAVKFAEQRQAEADQIAWELGQRIDILDAPALVQDFLYGPWSLVMAHARLSDPARRIDPGGHGTVVTDLLWSVKREMTLREPARLIEMLPGLLERLRTGLAALGQAPQESDPFFIALEKLHRPVLRLRARKRRVDSDFAPLEPEPHVDEPEPQAAVPATPQQGPWMGRHELDAAGFQDTVPSDVGELRPADGGFGAPAAPADIDATIAAFSEGCWVDLSARRRWLRAQLVWASTKGTLFMFVSHGGQPHSMTRRTCERLLRERLLRPVEMGSAVSHAIEALAPRREREAQAA
ncbi:DUF1631 family protein [Caenimonas terrae]|uniref:DUF1631 family protein n=1 Tax=Caenimonas terrae TaxID=696074 RepID=A0ABW0N7B7_9BURK